MAAGSKKKVPRKVMMVRVICVIIAILMIVPVLISSMLIGASW